VGKGWSWLFGVVLMATFLIWVVAPFFGWWLPENISTYGQGVDNLFYVILGFTGFFFVVTEALLVYAMWRFAARPGEKAVYTHGNHRLEVFWTAVPAAILIFIAVAQIGVWSDIKYRSRMPSPDITVTVMARQWEWRMRYPVDITRFQFQNEGDRETRERQARAWAENAEQDDVHVTNQIHMWAGSNVRAWLMTRDVLHSFTIPNLRIKQDTVPGRTIPMWFNAMRANVRFNDIDGRLEEIGDPRDAWEIACQELCGGRHYAMRGRLYVHENQDSFTAWLRWSVRQQRSRQPDLAQGN